MAWWNKKSEQPVAEPVVQANPPAAAYEVLDAFAKASSMVAIDRLVDGESKTFDWVHYQAMTQGSFSSMFAGEFNLVPTMRVMKGMLLQEPWINYCTNAIAKQFLGAKFVLKLRQTADGQQQTVAKHDILEYLRDAGREVESGASFTSNRVADLITTGNAYWWNAGDLKDKRSIPADRMEPVVENNRIIRYRLLDRNHMGFTGPASQMVFDPEEITHIKLPNPFTPHVGLSMLIATTLPVLIEKYGREFVIGFFLRGGQTAGIIETKTSNVEQLMRLARTMMQAFGGRKNMHADKILPDGASWKGQGSSFRDIRLVDMLKDNVGHFRAATGCTNTVLGIVDNLNYATAKAEMELFWKGTVLPLQQLYCSGIMASSIWDRFGLDNRWELCFDNSGVEWIDDFSRRLEDDVKLAATWTVNERRERMGKKPIDRFEDKLESEIKPAGGPAPLNFAFPTVIEANPEKAAELPSAAPADAVARWKSDEEAIQEPTRAAVALFGKEFGAWEQIVLDNLENKSAAQKKVRARAGDFASALADKTLEPAMKAYENQIATLVDNSKSLGDVRTKESDQDRKAKLDLLKERARQVIKDGVLSNGKKNFLGYSDTAMDSVYALIQAEFEAGKSAADVAASVRLKFAESYGLDEAYPGQAETIVRTEFGSAVSIGQAKFGEDLASVSKVMSKSWVTLGDEHTRSSHSECEDQGPIEGEPSQVIDATFSNGLRYPREAGGPPEEVINCRCTIRYAVKEWAE